MPDNVEKAIKEFQRYPILTEEVTIPTPRPAAPGAPGAAPLRQIADGAIRDVLGWRLRVTDPKGFVAALKQAFSPKEVEGHTEWMWTPRTYAVQADMGAVTGAQASIFSRAKVALDQSLPLLDGLRPLKVDFDPEDIEASRAIIRSDLIELVNELGVEGGPRVARVNDLFASLLGARPDLTDPEQVDGRLAELRNRFGLEREAINTIEEEQKYTNFLILVEYVNTLRQSWRNQIKYFDRGLAGSIEPYFGTQLVRLSRQLAVIAESVQEAYFAMDSVFLGSAERETEELPIPGEAPITIAELLRWVERFASEEGPRLIKEAGKDGVVKIRSTLAVLEKLVRDAHQISTQHSSNPGPAFRTYRVQGVWEDLKEELGKATDSIKYFKRRAPTISRVSVMWIDPNVGMLGTEVEMVITGENFQTEEPWPAVMLVRGSETDEKDVQKVVFPTELRATVKAVQPTRIVASLKIPGGYGYLGVWSVVVTNPDGRRGQMNDAFTIIEPSKAPVPSPAPPPAPGPVPAPKPTLAHEPKVTDVHSDPEQGFLGEQCQMKIRGGDFDPDASVELRRTVGLASTVIHGKVESVEPTKIEAAFDLARIPEELIGDWEVVVVNPDKTQGAWRKRFRIRRRDRSDTHS